MDKIISFLVLWTVLIGCQKDKPPENNSPIDPCSKLVDGVYQYPTGPTPSGLTTAEKKEYWNIPENVLPCLKTDGLLETCLKHNSLSLYMLQAGCCGLQSGYELEKSWCRGLSELEIRPRALDTLINKYKSIDTIHYDTTTYPFSYGGYKFYTYCLEVFLAQEVYLKNASKDQNINLLTDLFVKQDFRKGQRGDYFIEGPTFVMARIMYFKNYQPLIDLFNQNSTVNSFIINGGAIQGDEPKMTIISLAKDYLNFLKAK